MSTVTIGDEAAELGRHGEWIPPKRLSAENELYVTQINDDEYLGAIIDYCGRVIVACDDPLVLGMISGILLREKLDLVQPNEDVAADIIAFVIPEICKTCTNVNVVGWDLIEDGGIKMNGIW